MGNSTCVAADYTGDNSPPDMAPYATSRPNIGDRFTHPGLCEYCGAGYITANCGTNGEFIPDGDGDGKCTCRAFCNENCCRKACKRIKYTGSTDKCCQLGGPDYYMEGNIVRTCDPAVRAGKWSAGVCDKNMLTYCKEGNNMFTESCRKWITTFQPAGDTVGYRANGDVDSVLLDVCNRPENAARDECACIVAANEVRVKLPNSSSVPVQCMMNKCANNPRAYRTASQSTPCNVTNCQIDTRDLQIIAGDPQSFNVGFTQNCGKTDPTTTPPTSTPSPTSPPSSTTPKPDTSPVMAFLQKYWIYLLVGLLVIAVVIIVIVILTRKSDNGDGYDNDMTSTDSYYHGREMY